MGRFGLVEILILVGIALLLFAGGRIADSGKGGGGLRTFKRRLREEGQPDSSVPSETKTLGVDEEKEAPEA